jgi:hypothetical protein
MTGYPFALVLSLVTLGFIVQLLRTRRLREKYAGLWLVLVVVIIVLTIVPDIAFRLASALGVQTPANLLFAGSLVVLLLVSIQLSTEVSHLEEETRTLAERTAILGHRIEVLERQAEAEAPEGAATRTDDTPQPSDDRTSS